MVNGQFSELFRITKGVLQGDTLASFLFIIVLDCVLKVTELGMVYKHAQNNVCSDAS